MDCPALAPRRLCHEWRRVADALRRPQSRAGLSPSATDTFQGAVTAWAGQGRGRGRCPGTRLKTGTEWKLRGSRCHGWGSVLPGIPSGAVGGPARVLSPAISGGTAGCPWGTAWTCGLWPGPVASHFLKLGVVLEAAPAGPTRAVYGNWFWSGCPVGFLFPISVSRLGSHTFPCSRPVDKLPVVRPPASHASGRCGLRCWPLKRASRV